MKLRRSFAVLVLGACAVAACGESNEPVAAPPDTSPDTTSDSPADTSAEATGEVTPAGGSSPKPTIPADIPEDFLPGIGPIAVEGAVLEGLPEVGDDPAIGRSGPVLVGEDFDGNAVRVDPAVDGPTWLIFLAHWCPHCNDEIPVINQLRDDGLLPDGLNVVGVSTASNPTRPNFPPGEWLVDRDWTFGVLADGIDVERQTYVAAEAYGVNSFPFSVLVDGDGVVVDRWSGGRTGDELASLVANGLGLS